MGDNPKRLRLKHWSNNDGVFLAKRRCGGDPDHS
jgi:hypothetical protein